MPPESDQQPVIAAAVTEISERASVLIREEIELAKAEVTEKVTKLAKGAAVGLAAGIFVVVGLLFLLHAAAWAFYLNVFNDPWWGFAIVAGILIALGAVAGLLASKWIKGGSPPKPEMAIDEARRIKETVSGDGPTAPPIAPGGAVAASTKDGD